MKSKLGLTRVYGFPLPSWRCIIGLVWGRREGSGLRVLVARIRPDLDPFLGSSNV